MTRIKLVDKSATYYATRRFTMDGVEYQQDQEVPVGKLDDRSAVRLIKSTYVTDRKPRKAAAPVTQPVAPVTQPVAPVAAVTQPVAAAPTTATGLVGKLFHAAAPTTAAGLVGKLFHAGGGQWEVQDENGVNMLPDRIKGKDMAKMAAEQFGITIVE
jgi:hypothetical protein